MKNKKILAILALFILIIILASSVFLSNKNSDEIKIGVILPLSGEQAVIGDGIRNALELANNQLSKPYKIIYEDDGFDPKKGVAAYLKLRNIDKVNVIINTSPTTADAIEPLVKESPILVFQIAEPSKSSDDTIFQIMPSASTLYTELGHVVSKYFSKVAFVYQDTATFKNAVSRFSESFGTASSSNFVISDKSDVLRIATLIANNKEYEAVSILATPGIGVPFLSRWYLMKGSTQKIFCNPDMEVTITPYVESLGNKPLEDCVSVFFRKQDNRFSNLYEKQYNKKPAFAADYAYDLIDLINKTYDPEVFTMKSNLSSINYEGLSGLIRFDGNGTRVGDFSEKVFKDGVFVEV
jgi:branched-chain amino acid transport system substrate-binding protein